MARVSGDQDGRRVRLGRNPQKFPMGHYEGGQLLLFGHNQVAKARRFSSENLQT